MEIFQSILELFGGLAIFVYGVHVLSEGLEKVAGGKLLTMLDKSLNNPLKQGLFGTVATALMQSSGLLMVTMIGLINANMLSLQQAIGIMLGQEIGTTITGQMVSFQIKGFNLVFLIIGFFMMFFSKNRKLRMIGQPFFGFGIVVCGHEHDVHGRIGNQSDDFLPTGCPDNGPAYPVGRFGRSSIHRSYPEQYGNDRPGNCNG